MTSSRTFSGAAALLILLGTLLPANTFAEGELSLVLEPHCSEQPRDNCPPFDVSDPTHLQTKTQSVGDILDLDVVLSGGMNRSIKKIRSWLHYDAQVLEVRSVELTSVLTEPLPGEQSADAGAGVVKIGGGLTSVINDNRIAVARVTFRVIGSGGPSEISFSGFQDDGLGHTAVNGAPEEKKSGKGLSDPPCMGGLICQKKIIPLLTMNPSALTVLLQPAQNADTVAVAASISQIPAIADTPAPAQNQPEQQQKALPQSTNGDSSFSLLQVQNLRITSRERSIFLTWQPLRSSALAGTNIYYGTVSGRYIQRRSIPKDSSSIVLRDLEPGTTYFMAVRAYNGTDQETVFSQEVSVTVGDPNSSSAPMIASIEDMPAVDGNPIENHGGTEINGTTGMSDTVIVFAILSAVIGTAFAVRRQYAF